MIRPQPFAFITGIAAFIPWNTPDRLIAMIWSHRSSGKSSTLAVNWMPALFTRMSTEPRAFTASATIPAICAGLLMSAPLYATLTPCVATISDRSASICPASPNPFSMISAPAVASARAMPSPIPLVDPVTTATLPFRLMVHSFHAPSSAVSCRAQ